MLVTKRLKLIFPVRGSHRRLLSVKAEKAAGLVGSADVAGLPGLGNNRGTQEVCPKWDRLPDKAKAAQAAFSEADSCALRLIVQNDMGEGAVNFQAAVVIDEAQPSKFIHEITDVLPSRTHHLRQRFLTYLRKDTLGLAFLSVTG